MLSDDPLIETLEGLVHVGRDEDALILHPGAPPGPGRDVAPEVITDTPVPAKSDKSCIYQK